MYGDIDFTPATPVKEIMKKLIERHGIPYVLRASAAVYEERLKGKGKTCENERRLLESIKGKLLNLSETIL